MRSFIWAALLCVACDGGSSANDGDDPTEGTTPIAGLCDDIPQFDLEGFACEQIVSAFEQTVDAARACNQASDCHAESGQCDRFDSLCYYAVNSCVDSATVSSFATPWAPCQADDQCTCSGVPEVDCIDGECEVVD